MKSPKTIRSSIVFALVMLAGYAGVASAQITGDVISTSQGDLVVHPIGHATFVMGWNGKAIYVDPVGGADRFAGLPDPDLILVTDIHGDHMNAETLEAILAPATVIVAPAAVADQLPASLTAQTISLANGQRGVFSDVGVEGVPMYNLTEDRLRFHEKGRGNGYVVSLGGTRVYIAGDTEDVPEMRALQDIDAAFIPMNLPFTMTPEQAAGGVIAFAPEVVYPYHFGESDVQAFTALVEAAGGGTEVRLIEWYP